MNILRQIIWILIMISFVSCKKEDVKVKTWNGSFEGWVQGIVVTTVIVDIVTNEYAFDTLYIDEESSVLLAVNENRLLTNFETPTAALSFSHASTSQNILEEEFCNDGDECLALYGNNPYISESVIMAMTFNEDEPDQLIVIRRRNEPDGASIRMEFIGQRVVDE